MVQVGTLDIRIVACDDGVDLIVNGRYTHLLYSEVTTLEDLRLRLQYMPPYVYNTVIELLKEMAP